MLTPPRDLRSSESLSSCGGASKLSIKKLQSQSKVHVNQFGKLILSWRSDVAQIQILLDELQNLCRTRDLVDNERRSQQLDSIFILFPDCGQKLSAKLLFAIESIYVQLRLFE